MRQAAISLTRRRRSTFSKCDNVDIPDPDLDLEMSLLAPEVRGAADDDVIVEDDVIGKGEKAGHIKEYCLQDGGFGVKLGRIVRLCQVCSIVSGMFEYQGPYFRT